MLALKQFFLFNKRSNKNENIFFFSEGFSSWNILSSQFKLFKENFLDKVIYLTSDLDEYNYLNKNFENIYYTGSGSIRTIWLNSLNGNSLITTIPDLNLYQWKKSKFIKNYIYLFHSLGSTFYIYNDKAFDSYDMIMCSSSYQYEELEKNKIKKNLSQKLFKSGYTLIENIDKNIISRNNEITNILFALTWSIDKGLANFYLEQIIDILKKINNTKVIARFHPMTLKKNEKTIDKLKSDNLIHIDNTNNFESYFNSDILITDWSTCSIEYALITKNPSIHINTEYKKRNKSIDINFINHTFEKNIRSKIGIELEINQLHKIDKDLIVNLKNNDDIKSNINNLNKYIFNYSNTNKVIYEQICNEIF